MSGHSAEEIRGEMRKYWVVGAALFLLTVITVAASYLDVPVGMAVIIGLVIATLKGGLVAAVFMHLISERQAIYALLGLTMVFFVVLMVGAGAARLGSTAVL